MARKMERNAEDYDPLDGLGDEIERRVTMKIHQKLGGRGNAVMTRLSDDDLRKIDALVELDMFRSRSEAVAFLVEEGMKARSDLIDNVMPTIEKIQNLKEAARRSIQNEPTGTDDEVEFETEGRGS